MMMMIACWELPIVCHDTQCRYFTRMTYVGRSRYGNCAIRVANDGSHTLNELSEILGVSRERVRQLEASALRHLSYNSLKLDERTLDVVRKTLCDITWPPRSLKSVKSFKSSQARLLKLMFDQGVLSEFMKRSFNSTIKRRVHQHIRCPVLSDVVEALICLLCDQRSTCCVCPVRGVDPRSCFIVGSFKELVEVLKIKLGLRAPDKLRDRIVAYYKDHPTAPISHIAAAVGASYVYTRKVLKRRNYEGNR